MEWPDNPLAALLSQQLGFIGRVLVAALRRPETPIAVRIEWCEQAGDELARRRASSLELDVPWKRQREVHAWCAELAWAMGSPELERADWKGTEDYTGRGAYSLAADLRGRFGTSCEDLVVEATNSGCSTWHWVSVWGRFEYMHGSELLTGSGPAVPALAEARRRDPELAEDGSRALQYPWLDKPQSQIFDVTPIAADLPKAVRIYEFAGLRVERARRRAGDDVRPPRRRGRSIPEDVLARVEGWHPDLPTLVAKIRNDPVYAPLGEELLADYCLCGQEVTWATSPLTFDEMMALNPCLTGESRTRHRGEDAPMQYPLSCQLVDRYGGYLPPG